MTEKREYDLLKFFPQEFDLNHSGLSSIFCYAGLGIDNHLLKRDSDDEYLVVIRTGKILYQYAEKAKARIKKDKTNIDPFSDMFFFKLLQEQGEKPKTVEDIANSVMQIGLDFIKLRELPETRKKELRTLSIKLSERARNWWHEYYPNGFRRYCAA